MTRIHLRILGLGTALAAIGLARGAPAAPHSTTHTFDDDNNDGTGPTTGGGTNTQGGACPALTAPTCADPSYTASACGQQTSYACQSLIQEQFQSQYAASGAAVRPVIAPSDMPGGGLLTSAQMFAFD